MPNFKPLEGLTSAIGEGLTEFRGYQITRVAQVARTESQVQTAFDSMDYDGALTVTLTSGTFLAGLVGGQRVRVLSGVATGAEAVVDTRDSDTQLTLLAQLLDADGNPVAAFAAASWEVVDDADSELLVESTHGFPSDRSFRIDGVDYFGRIALDGRVYYYTGLTVASFTGLQYDDGTGTFRPGVAQDHLPLTQVDDYSRRLSAVDVYRRSFLVGFAEGEDLSVVGRNLGLDRPAVLADDDVFRELVKAATYAPRATVFGIEQILDVLLGVGNYVLFEDMTLASGDVGAGQQRNRNTVFLAKVANAADAENPNGKTFVDGYTDAPLTAAGVVTVAPDDVLNVASVQHAPETSRVTVAEGGGAATSNGTTVTFPPGSIPAYVFSGDVLVVTSGPRQSDRATVQTRTSDTQVVLGEVLGFPNPSDAESRGLGGSFSGASWQIVRNESRFGHYLPEDESILEAGAVRADTWEFVEQAPDALSDLEVASTTFGPVLNVRSNDTPTRRAVWRRAIRIQPEDRFVASALLDVEAPVNTVDSTRGCFMAFSDGERVMSVSMSPVVGRNAIQFGLSDVVADSFLHSPEIWGGFAATLFVPGLNAVWIEKDGRGDVRLYRANRSGDSDPTPAQVPYLSDRELVAAVPYTDFPTVGDYRTAFEDANYTVGNHELVFGSLDTAAVNTSRWKFVSWEGSPARDWWNRQLTTPAASAGTITAAGQFSGADVGRSITVKDFTVPGADGGNALGVWEILSQSGGSVATVVGHRRSSGSFTLEDTSRFVVGQDEYPFRWPDHVDHSVEILSGSNAGIYAIEDVLDPESFQPYAADALGTAGFTSAAAVRNRRRSNAVRVVGTFVPGELDVEWRLRPNFAVDPALVAEVSDAGSEAAGVLTLGDATPFPAGTLMRVYYSKVLSAYLYDVTENNQLVTESPLVYTHYPAYLYDAFGYVRTIVDFFTAAGVIPDFDSLYVDAAGEHIRGS